MHLFRKQESNKLKYQEFGSTLIDWQARDIMSKTIENTHNTIDGYENENSRDSGEDQLAVTVNFVNKRKRYATFNH